MAELPPLKNLEFSPTVHPRNSASRTGDSKFSRSGLPREAGRVLNHETRWGERCLLRPPAGGHGARSGPLNLFFWAGDSD